MRTAMTTLISQDVEALLLPKFHRINKKLPKEVSKCHHEPICLLFLLVFKSNIFPLFVSWPYLAFPFASIQKCFNVT